MDDCVKLYSACAVRSFVRGLLFNEFRLETNSLPGIISQFPVLLKIDRWSFALTAACLGIAAAVNWTKGPSKQQARKACTFQTL